MFASWILIGLNLIVFFITDFIFNNTNIKVFFGLNVYFLNGAWWQIFTTLFIHANFLHLFMNMSVLYGFGSLLERHLGSIKFAFLYVIGGVLTSILSLSYLLVNTSVNLIGASGAICVLLGFIAFYDKANTKGLLIALLVMSFAPLLLGISVAWYAHIFGFGVGYLAGKFRNAIRFF